MPFPSAEVRCPAAVVMSLDAAAPFIDSFAEAHGEAVWQAALLEYRTTRALQTDGCGSSRHPTVPGSPFMAPQLPDPSPIPPTVCTAGGVTDFLALTAAVAEVSAALGGAGASSTRKNSEDSQRAKAEAALVAMTVDEMGPADLLLTTAVREADRDVCRRALTLAAAGDKRAAAAALAGLVEATPTGEVSPLLLNAAAACSYQAELWEGAARLSRRMLERCQPCGVAQRRLCRIAVAMGDAVEARRLTRPFRRDPRWHAEHAAVSLLERYEALLAARQLGEAAEAVAAMLLLIPCGDVASWAVELVLRSEGPAAGLAYATAQAERFPACAALRRWRCEALFQCAATTEALAIVRRELAGELGQSTITATSAAIRELDARVAAAAVHVAVVEAAWRASDWERVVTCCTGAITAGAAAASDAVAQLLFTQRAAAHLRGGRVYPALDDAQRALTYAEADAARAELLTTIATCEERLGRLRDALYHEEQAARCVPSVARSAHVRELAAKLSRERRAGTGERSGGASSTWPGSGSDRTRPRQGERASGPSAASCASPPPVPSPFVVLCVPPDIADAQLVRRAYRALAVRWHPDKWCGHSAAEVQEAEAQFKAIQSAYEIVTALLTKNAK